MIQNPILKGFNPDPCITRVEDTYYIVVSSFEWCLECGCTSPKIWQIGSIAQIF